MHSLNGVLRFPDFPAVSYGSLVQVEFPPRLFPGQCLRPSLASRMRSLVRQRKRIRSGQVFGHGGVYRIIGQQVEAVSGQFFRICCCTILHTGPTWLARLVRAVPGRGADVPGTGARRLQLEMRSSMASSSSVVVKPPMPRLYKRCSADHRPCKNSYSGNPFHRVEPATRPFFAWGQTQRNHSLDLLFLWLSCCRNFVSEKDISFLFRHGHGSFLSVLVQGQFYKPALPQQDLLVGDAGLSLFETQTPA